MNTGRGEESVTFTVLWRTKGALHVYLQHDNSIPNYSPALIFNVRNIMGIIKTPRVQNAEHFRDCSFCSGLQQLSCRVWRTIKAPLFDEVISTICTTATVQSVPLGVVNLIRSFHNKCSYTSPISTSCRTCVGRPQTGKEEIFTPTSGHRFHTNQKQTKRHVATNSNTCRQVSWART